MILTLPPSESGRAATIDTSRHSPIVIIGANGAGKTRFTNRLCADLGQQAFHLNVVDALYREGEPDPEHNAVDRMCMESHLSSPSDRLHPRSRLERLMGLILSDELANLLSYKYDPGSDGPEKGPMPETRLDKLFELWHDIFPENRVLIHSGRILFGRTDSDDLYNAGRLSDGERAVLYYGIALLYAPENAVVVVDSPEMFLHQAIVQAVWNRLKLLRPDCVMVYTTHDLEFAAAQRGAAIVWVRGCDLDEGTFDYRLMPSQNALTDQVYMSIVGARKPVMFIEGDEHSIDARLYPLIFPDYSVKSLGSCNKVIESTRTFNDLNGFHHLTAYGIVDRDRRDEGEVEYLRRKNIMVPEVAEIENLLLIPEVVKAVARNCGVNAEKVYGAVKKSVLAQFKKEVRAQALQHTRHRVKRTLEYRIDGRFNDINALENHIYDLAREINPRALYESFCREFHSLLAAEDYVAVLRVFNQKSMLSASNVAQLCGLKSKDAYIDRLLSILRNSAPEAPALRKAVRSALKA